MTDQPNPAIKVQVDDDWQRDGVRLIPYRQQREGTAVGTVFTTDDSTPFMRLDFLLAEEGNHPDPHADLRGIILQTDVAHAIMLALLTHFGYDPKAAPHALLASTLEREQTRVDKMLDSLLAPIERPETGEWVERDV
jgi:hypothetical protein